MELTISDDVLFVIESGQLVAWNCRTHEQFEVSAPYLDALLKRHIDSADPIAEELASAGLLRDVAGKSSAWSWDRLSRIFHVGTSAERPATYKAAPKEQGDKYLEYCASISRNMPSETFNYRRGAETRLPDAPCEDAAGLANLKELLANRKTSRSFTGEVISASVIATILSETFAYRDHDEELFSSRGLSTPTRRRSSPSAGSLQSCEAYLFARQVDGLDEGVYHYWSDKAALGRFAPLPTDFSLGDLAAGQMLADELSALVIITCRFDKLAWKYPHSRAYRVALLDAGHLSQTFQLLATAQGLRTWITGMFFDWDIRRLLELDEDSQEYPLLMLGLGTGPYCPFDNYVGRP